MCAIGGQQTTVLRRPESRHGALGVAPERTVGIEVLFRMLGARKEEEDEREIVKEEIEREGIKRQTGGGVQEGREQILGHGEVGGRDAEWWKAKRSEKNGGRN